jgi:hypothetical protein
LNYEAGGEVKITDPTSPIRGTRVLIAPGTLGAPQETIQISYEDNLPGQFNTDAQLFGARQASKVLVLSRSSNIDLALPAKVTIPYDKTVVSNRDVPVVLLWDPKLESYHAAAVSGIDYSAGTITFKVAHFSQKIVVTVLKDIKDALTRTVDTGFRPQVDGFYVHNFGAYDSPGGSCLGMANYSGWYFDSKKQQRGAGLYSLYREGDAIAEEDDQNARELISRAFMLSSQYWAKLALGIQTTAGDTFTGIYLIQTMILTQSPQTLIMADEVPIKAFGHAAVVYRYDSALQRFEVYDNNFPRETVYLYWNLADGFSVYSKYNGVAQKFAFDSMHTSFSPETFEALFQGAESGWANSKFPKITLSQPQPHASSPHLYEVPNADDASFVANVPRAQDAENRDAPRYAHIYLNGIHKAASVPISASGDFSYHIGKLPNPLGTDVMILVSENKDDFRLGFHAFKQFKMRGQGLFFFKNFGFETGGFDFWTSERHLWGGGNPIIPSDKSVTTQQSFDPIAIDLPMVRFGRFSARINNFDPDYHISTVSQTAVVPDVSNPTLRFHWAAVLEDPSHSPEEQPYVEVTVYNQTKNAVLYNKRYYSNDPTYSGWQSYAGGDWKAIPWQVVDLNVKAHVNDSLLVKVEAADCSLGAHGGYAYLDGEE